MIINYLAQLLALSPQGLHFSMQLCLAIAIVTCVMHAIAYVATLMLIVEPHFSLFLWLEH